MKPGRLGLCAALAVCIAALLSAPSLERENVFAQGEGSIPRFEEAPCPFDLPSSVRCGGLIVPENRADPDSRPIRLGVAILASRSEHPAPDPVVYLEGGPGGSALAFARYWLGSPILDHRDLILLEQRGNIFSDPVLDCPEIGRAIYDGFTTAFSPGEEFGDFVDAMAACRDQLREQGIDFAGYSTAASAADVNDLRRALGYAQWNLYGISYGTRLALVTMRDYPEGVRSVVLDSTYPPDIQNFVDAVPGVDGAFETLFAACAADERCAAAFPDLEASFYRTVERLNATPDTVRTVHVYTRQPATFTLTGDDLVTLVFVALYDPALAPFVPFIIDQVAQGNSDALLPLAENGLAFIVGGISWGTNYTVECNDAAPLVSPEAWRAALEPFPALRGFAEERFNPAICDVWGAAGRGRQTGPLRSDIPTLVLAGEFDPTTPPQWGRRTAGALENGYFYVFPGQAHAVSTGGCPRDMALAFIDDPAAPPDSGCMSGMGHRPFTTGADIVPTPALYRLNSEFLTFRDPLQMALLGFALIFFLAEVLLWPVALLRWLRRRAAQQSSSRPARIARLLAGLTAALNLVLVLGLVLVVRWGMAENSLLLGFGVPPSAAPLLWLPPLTAVLSLALIGFAVLGWKNRWWSPVGRVHYTLLAAAALAFTAWMIQWDLLRF